MRMYASVVVNTMGDLRMLKELTDLELQFNIYLYIYILPFLDRSRTDEKDNNPLRCVNPTPS